MEPDAGQDWIVLLDLLGYDRLFAPGKVLASSRSRKVPPPPFIPFGLHQSALVSSFPCGSKWVHQMLFIWKSDDSSMDLGVSDFQTNQSRRAPCSTLKADDQFLSFIRSHWVCHAAIGSKP